MLISGIYSTDYFNLLGIDTIDQPGNSFWASKERYATVRPGTDEYLSSADGGVSTSEIYEIDYERVRQIMGLSFDIVHVPVDITIQYDAISTDDGSHRWVTVRPESGLRFDDTILYEPNSLPSFQRAEFYFSDFKSEMIHTRFLRIIFTRRDSEWPVRGAAPQKMPIVVRNLRSFRSVSDHKHMAGQLFESDITDNTTLIELDSRPDLTTQELTQRFTFPADAMRGEGSEDTADDLVPSMLGFSFLANVAEPLNGEDQVGSPTTSTKWRWSLWDVTGSSPVQLDKGLSQGAAHDGQCWINCYFRRALEGSTNATYEIRLSSRYTPSSSGIYASQPVSVPGFQIPSTFSAERRSRLMVVDDPTAGYGLMQVGDYIQAVDGLNSYQVISIGNPGGYASFDGISGRIDIDYDVAFHTAEFGVGFWYKRDAETMDDVESVIVDNSDADENGWRISIGPDGVSLDSALSVTAGGETLYDDEDTADGEWHHAFINFDGTDLVLYRDGEEKASVTPASYTPNADSDTKLCIGTRWGSDWDNLVFGEGEWLPTGTRYEGQLDDVVLFPAELDPAEITDIYDAGHGGSGTLATLVGYSPTVVWQLNEDPGATEIEDEIGAVTGEVQPSGVSFSGEQTDALIVEVNRGWREGDASRSMFIVPRMSYVKDGALVADYSKSLTMRLWADVGDTGRDVLGNAYRYATRKLDSASRVLDASSSGWMSAARPAADAVESLYFDVRQTLDTGQLAAAIIDVIRIAPRTHGVRMHVYYTQDNLFGSAPKDEEIWDHMLWTPVNEIYNLRRNEAIQLPRSIKATYVKLEFTNLRPLPFAVAPFPELPPVEYKRYPTWVENAFDNAQLRRTVEDWFIQKADPVQRRILQEISDPVREFQYKSREFMMALSNGSLDDARIIGSGLVDQSTGIFIDPITSSKIRLNTNRMNQGSLTGTIRTDSLLGKAVTSRTESVTPLMIEARPPIQDRSAFVSTRGDRITHSFSTLSETPMWFNRRCRHFYRIDKARFNRKAYYVGIRDVEFRRNDYTVSFDDDIIDDDLHDDEFLELNSFVRDPMTKIESGSLVYVSYKKDGVQFSDEAVTLNGVNFVDLAEIGSVLTEIAVHSLPNRRGVQYDIDMDYMISNAYQADGDITTQIARSDATEYLAVGEDSLVGVTFRDHGMASATGFAFAEES